MHGAGQAHVHVAGPTESAEGVAGRTSRCADSHSSCADLHQDAFHVDSQVGLILASSKAAARRPCGRDVWAWRPDIVRLPAIGRAGCRRSEQARTEEDL